MKKMIAALLICLLLTGCWDQVQLKKMLFADIIGLDYEGDSKQLRVSFVISSLQNVSQGGGTQKNSYHESTGTNIYEAVNRTNRGMPGILSVLETRLFLISTRFAKDQPLNYLNITGQFIANPLYGYLAVYDGDFAKLLAKKKLNNDQTPSEFLVSILDDEKKRGKIPSNQLFHYIFGGAEFLNDFALNLFEPYGDSARLAGTALFKDGKYTGINLSNEGTQLAVLLNVAEDKNQLLLDGEIGGKKSYTALIQHAHRDFDVIYDHDVLREIKISLKLNLKLVSDGPDVKKHTNDMFTELEKEIATDLTEKVSIVMATLQKANCDYLQLGHVVAAYHPKLFEGKDWWRDEYPKLTITPNVQIEILNTGVLD